MHKTSKDLRFTKNRAILQRAFIDLTLEKRSTHITVKELTDRAGVNRMTFYSHYDEVSDILLEFVDGMTAQLLEVRQNQEANLPDIKQLLLDATALMQEEIEFYRLVAQDQHFELYRAQFRKAFTTIFTEELKKSTFLEGFELEFLLECWLQESPTHTLIGLRETTETFRSMNCSCSVSVLFLIYPILLNNDKLHRSTELQRL